MGSTDSNELQGVPEVRDRATRRTTGLYRRHAASIHPESPHVVHIPTVDEGGVGHCGRDRHMVMTFG